MFFINSRVPERATVPILFTNSSSVIPIPLSSIENICFLESISIFILNSASGSTISLSINFLKRSLLRASEELDTNSRKKTSG